MSYNIYNKATDSLEQIAGGADNRQIASVSAKIDEVRADVPFKFGIDENGNYGYVKEGADSVTPFSGNVISISHGAYNQSNARAMVYCTDETATSFGKFSTSTTFTVTRDIKFKKIYVITTGSRAVNRTLSIAGTDIYSKSTTSEASEPIYAIQAKAGDTISFVVGVPSTGSGQTISNAILIF